MNDTIRFILSLSIAPAVIMGMVRYRKMDASYHPFLYYTWFVLLFEILVYLLSTQKAYNTLGVLFNLYAFVEFVLLTWIFHKWGLFKRNRAIVFSIMIIFFFIWVFTIFYFKGIYKKSNHFAIAYSFALIFYSISSFHRLVIQEYRSIFINAKFWICTGVIIFYSYFVIGSSVRLLIQRSKANVKFFEQLQEIDVYSNLLVNILYAIAIIWIPNKKKNSLML
jgi:hypothetical protein